MTIAIRTDGLTKYFGSRCVVDSVSLSIPAGTVFGFLGRNGAGKSTTIRMLMGLVQPTRGTAELLGHEVSSLPANLRGRIAYLAEGHPLYGWMTVAQTVRFSRAFYRERWNQRLLDQILDHFELPSRSKTRRLSRGQRAQFALALAIAPDPDLLILDDPTLGLDTVARRDFLGSLIQLIQRQGRTILFSSHILTDVERVADRIGILVDGVLRVDCPTEHFKQSLRKVLVEFAATPPVLPALPGLVSSSATGNRLDLVMVNFGPQQQHLIDSLKPLTCDVVELGLEDAFVAFTRGSKPPLPAFDQEPGPADENTPDKGAA